MAVDTKAKRFSMLSFSDGALLPVADGSIGTADRAHLLWLYGGIALTVGLDVISTVTLLGEFDTTQTLLGEFDTTVTLLGEIA